MYSYLQISDLELYSLSKCVDWVQQIEFCAIVELPGSVHVCEDLWDSLSIMQGTVE
jgi:hypothetical protein